MRQNDQVFVMMWQGLKDWAWAGIKYWLKLTYLFKNK